MRETFSAVTRQDIARHRRTSRRQECVAIRELRPLCNLKHRQNVAPTKHTTARTRHSDTKYARREVCTPDHEVTQHKTGKETDIKKQFSGANLLPPDTRHRAGHGKQTWGRRQHLAPAPAPAAAAVAPGTTAPAAVVAAAAAADAAVITFGERCANTTFFPL